MRVQAKHCHIVWFTLMAVLLGQSIVHAQLGPRPPCQTDTLPTYPGLGDAAIVKAWSKSELGEDWSPPECTGWASAGFTTLVTITARFRYNGKVQDFLQHIGAISQLRGLRYWSITHKEWQTLIVDAYALTGDQPKRGRGDFESNEMTAGSVLYYVIGPPILNTL
jgi:hypothetical protein